MQIPRFPTGSPILKKPHSSVELQGILIVQCLKLTSLLMHMGEFLGKLTSLLMHDLIPQFLFYELDCSTRQMLTFLECRSTPFSLQIKISQVQIKKSSMLILREDF